MRNKHVAVDFVSISHSPVCIAVNRTRNLLKWTQNKYPSLANTPARHGNVDKTIQCKYAESFLPCAHRVHFASAIPCMYRIADSSWFNNENERKKRKKRNRWKYLLVICKLISNEYCTSLQGIFFYLFLSLSPICSVLPCALLLVHECALNDNSVLESFMHQCVVCGADLMHDIFIVLRAHIIQLNWRRRRRTKSEIKRRIWWQVVHLFLSYAVCTPVWEWVRQSICKWRKMCVCESV